MKIKLLFACIFYLVSFCVIAQQDPQFTHYMYNTISVNPAYAGSRGALTVAGLYRNQWLGLEGAPVTQTFYVHSPLKNDKMGLGFSAVNDKIGPVNQTFLYADYAYHLKITEKIKLALGLKAGLNLFQIKLPSLETTVSNDPSFVNSTQPNSSSANIGFGSYFYSDKWYVGVSSPKLLENTLKVNEDIVKKNTILEKRHLFFIAGMIFPLNDNMKLKPTLMAKYTQNAPLSIDGTLEAYFNNRFSLGLGYRLGDSFSALAGLNLNQQLRLGVAYDYTLSALQKINSGTFEMLLQYDFLFKRDKIKSPRYF